MITKNITKQPKAVVEIQVTVPWSDIQPIWDQTLTRMAQDIELPGFRKGQAPLPMAEQALGQKLQDEVFRVLMPQSLMQALQGTEIVPIDYPQYQITAFQKGTQLQFSARVTERPTIQIGDYKTIKAPRPEVKLITDEDTKKVIEDLFTRWKARQPMAPQPSAISSQSSDQNQSVQPGDTTAGSLSFNQPAVPEAPQATPATSQLPEQPDDKFALAVGANNLLDLQNKIKQDLEDEAKYNNELDYEEAILQEVEKVTQVDLPEILVQDELNRMLLSLQRNISDRGMLMEDYLKSQNKTADLLKEEWRPQAEKNVRMELGLSEIAKREGVNISDEELQAEIDKVQDAKVKQQFEQQEPRMHLRHALRQTKTLNLLKTVVG